MFPIGLMLVLVLVASVLFGVMAFTVLHNPKAAREAHNRGGRSYDLMEKWADAHGDENTLRENAGSKALDSDGELHVDLSGSIDDLGGARIDIFGSARMAQWLPHQSDVTLVFTNLAGNFVKGETITGADSGATAVVESIEGEATGFLQVSTITDEFEDGEEIEGGGGATADLGTEADVVEIPKQRILIAQVRELSTGAVTGGTPTVTYTGEATAIGA